MGGSKGSVEIEPESEALDRSLGVGVGAEDFPLEEGVGFADFGARDRSVVQDEGVADRHRRTTR